MSGERPDRPYVTPVKIFSALEGIEWICETSKTIDDQQQASDLFGYLNPLRAFCITVLSENEIEWVYAQSEQSLSQSPTFAQEDVVVVILCDSCSPNPSLKSMCISRDIGLAKTRVSSTDVLNQLRFQLPRMVALRSVQHGVFLAVMNTGILITGASGVGKSEVAMDLVQRGHQLVADDAVETFRSDQDGLIGECPEPLRGYIEIRGLGIINILKMFGPSAVLDSYRLQLIIDLQDSTDAEIQKIDRLSPSLDYKEILGVKVPCLTMLVAPGRNLSVLVEAAVRDHLLKVAGMNSNEDFLQQHDEMMKQANHS